MALTGDVLTTLATVKDELKIAVSTFDTRLERLITAVSALIRAYCDREFHYQEDKSESVVGHGGYHLFLGLYPIKTITSISFDGSALSVDDYEVHNADSGLVYLKGGSIWTAQGVWGIGGNGTPGAERRLYEVVHTSGWVTPQQVILDNSLTRDLPQDLEDAAIMLTAWRYLNLGRDQSVVSESVLSASQSRAAVNVGTAASFIKAASPMAHEILQRYRRMVL